jgi:AcrR family transcriptional regulator
MPLSCADTGTELMPMAPPKAPLAIKAPQRQRGHARVGALLEAAGLCFAEKGYDATTMTEIAARAGASIGSLYQFFPTRELIAGGLLERYSHPLFDRMRVLRESVEGGTDAQVARRLLRVLVDFRRDHPGFVNLSEATHLPPSTVLGIRNRMRDAIAAILALRAPAASPARIRSAAFVTLDLMKSYVALSVEPGIRPRKGVLDEHERLLVLYLGSLTPD